MPNDSKVLRETMKQLSFVMQSTKIEGLRVHEVLAQLGRFEKDAFIFIQTTAYYIGGLMIAFRNEGNKNTLVCPAGKTTADVSERIAEHIWIRWDDLADRSPFPRRVVTRGNGTAPRNDPCPDAETDCYKPFQPNPFKHNAGDCVVRAVSRVMEIPWTDAVDLLAAERSTTINARSVFPLVLENNGYRHHKPILQNGRRLSGKAFCEEMSKMYRNGERVFAYVGPSHVAAVVPVEEVGDSCVYKIIDSWNSSKRSIGDFWVGSAKPGKDAEPLRNCQNTALSINEQLRHLVFGTGMITAAASGILTVDFKGNGVRLLKESWVRESCFPYATDSAGKESGK